MNKTIAVAWKIISGNKTVRKSTNALAVTLVGGLGTALVDGDVTGKEVIAVVGVALVATSAVWKGNNRVTRSQR